ncbi:MAG: glutamine-hydrolyzing GMP synthase [Armatimonadota bacterium]
MVVILDFGGQYTQLIARRVRECRVYCEILPSDTSIDEIKRCNPKAIILSGGPSSVYLDNAPEFDKNILNIDIPLLGICYGHQLMAVSLGGKVEAGELREYGKTEIKVLDDKGLFSGLEGTLNCWMSHGDIVSSAPEGFVVTASTQSTSVAAMEDRNRKLYGIQFHPEVVHTPWGIDVIQNFLYKECGLTGTWTPASFIDSAIKEIRNTVGNERVVCGVSGGIDSSCVAALIHAAIGDQLTCIFVDHGLLRANEGEKVRRMFEGHFKMKLVYVDAQERFLSRLKGVTDPEQKRKIIGDEFYKIFEEHASQIKDAKFLGQGTLYPDVIESGTKTAAVIKSHHNVGGLPKNMNLKLIEPVRYLFKDEVRAVSAELGIPDDMVWRQPFPGPGLAIRIVGEVTKERLDTLRHADEIIVSEIKSANLYKELWMAFGVLAPIRSVGVMGDQRTYNDTIVLRAVTSEDAMTADWARLPYDVMEKISNRIINEVKGVNRVVYDISSKPPATIEWE